MFIVNKNNEIKIQRSIEHSAFRQANHLKNKFLVIHWFNENSSISKKTTNGAYSDRSRDHSKTETFPKCYSQYQLYVAFLSSGGDLYNFRKSELVSLSS